MIAVKDALQFTDMLQRNLRQLASAHYVRNDPFPCIVGENDEFCRDKPNHFVRSVRPDLRRSLPASKGVPQCSAPSKTGEGSHPL